MSLSGCSPRGFFEVLLSRGVQVGGHFPDSFGWALSLIILYLVGFAHTWKNGKMEFWNNGMKGISDKQKHLYAYIPTH
jgi:hypothetical protein